MPDERGWKDAAPAQLTEARCIPSLRADTAAAAPRNSNQSDSMKVRNSLKSLRSRHRSNRVVRRKGRVYVINKTQRRFKARQG